MKNLINISIAISILITIVSCKKDLVLEDLGDVKDEIVLNGLIYADSTGQINVTRSISILGKESEKVILENANVTMTNGNNSSFTFEYDSDGYYSLNGDHFKANETYNFTVSNSGFSSASARLTIPPKINIVSIDTSITYGIDPFCTGCNPEQNLKLKVNLSSSTLQKEYFIVSFYNFDTLYSGYFDEAKDIWVDEKRFGKSYIDLNSYENKLKLVKTGSYLEEVFDDGYYYYGYELFFEKPEGVTEHNFTVYNYHFYVPYYTPDYYISVTAISEEYYKHQLSLARAYYAQDDFLAEKVSIFTNIENGMGIMGGANTSIRKIDFSNHSE